MPTSHELKREIEKLEKEYKEAKSVEELTLKKQELLAKLNPPKQPTGFRKFLGAVAIAEKNRPEPIKKPYKQIDLKSLGI